MAQQYVGWKAIKAALIKRLQGVSGLSSVLDHEPTSVGTKPVAWVLFEDDERTWTAQTTAMSYGAVIRVAVSLQDNAGAEALLDDLVNSIPAALDADPRSLGLAVGVHNKPKAEGMWLRVGGAEVRAHQYHFRYFENAASQCGI